MVRSCFHLLKMFPKKSLFTPKPIPSRSHPKMLSQFFLLICSSLLVQAIPFDPENPADRAVYLDELEQTLDSVRRALEVVTVVPREEEDEEGTSSGEGLNNIATGILKIVGSALAGNITSVIDNSVALFPAEGNVGNRISNVLGVLVQSVQNATGINFSNRATTTTGAPSKSKATKATTVTTQLTTNSEEEEEEQELRSNSTATVRSSTITNPTVLAISNNVTTTPSTTLPTTTPSAVLDPDNRANWISLLLNGSESIQNLNQVSEDVGPESTSAPTKNSNSFGNKLNLLLLLGPNKPNFSNYSAILHKFDQLQNAAETTKIPEASPATTTAAILKDPTGAATRTTAAAPPGNATEGSSVGPISVFTQFVTEQTTEDDDEDEDEDDNAARI